MNITAAVIAYALVIGGLLIALIDDTFPRVVGIGIAIAGLIFFVVFGRGVVYGQKTYNECVQERQILEIAIANGETGIELNKKIIDYNNDVNYLQKRYQEDARLFDDSIDWNSLETIPLVGGKCPTCGETMFIFEDEEYCPNCNDSLYPQEKSSCRWRKTGIRSKGMCKSLGEAALAMHRNSILIEKARWPF